MVFDNTSLNLLLTIVVTSQIHFCNNVRPMTSYEVIVIVLGNPVSNNSESVDKNLKSTIAMKKYNHALLTQLCNAKMYQQFFFRNDYLLVSNLSHILDP